jgi:chorismate mutase
MMRGIRGANTVAENTKPAVFAAVQELLGELVARNDLELADIGAAIFSATPDINAAFPAAAARKVGWDLVPLFGTQELDVAGGLKMCVRVLLLVDTDKPQADIKHVYLGDSNCLRPDIAKRLM